MTDDRETPAGPLDSTAVFVCSGCGVLVADQDTHAPVCPGQAAERLGERIIEWLDSFDPEQLEAAALAQVGFDANGTIAVLDQLKREAAKLQ